MIDEAKKAFAAERHRISLEKKRKLFGLLMRRQDEIIAELQPHRDLLTEFAAVSEQLREIGDELVEEQRQS